MESLISALVVALAARDVPLRADPTRSPFRIYRDARFSTDKSPHQNKVDTDSSATSDRERLEAVRMRTAWVLFNSWAIGFVVLGAIWLVTRWWSARHRRSQLEAWYPNENKVFPVAA